MVANATRNTDQRIAQEKSVTPAFVFASLLWHAQRKAHLDLQGRDLPDHEKEHIAYDEAIAMQIERVAIPRRFTSYVREIWSLQKKFEKRTPKRVERLVDHRRFRTAYDFLLLRAQSGEDISDLADWWTSYEQGSSTVRTRLLKELGPSRTKKRRRRKPKPKADSLNNQ